MTIFVTLDSIRNSCDVILNLISQNLKSFSSLAWHAHFNGTFLELKLFEETN